MGYSKIDHNYISILVLHSDYNIFYVRVIVRRPINQFALQELKTQGLTVMLGTKRVDALAVKANNLISYHRHLIKFKFGYDIKKVPLCTVYGLN